MQTAFKALVLATLLSSAALTPFAAAPSIAQDQRAASPHAYTIKDMKIGSPVYAADGVKVGEINRIKADSDGKVTEVQITTGGPAGLNAEAVAITPDKIATTDPQSLRLSLSATDAKKLPVLSDDKG